LKDSTSRASPRHVTHARSSSANPIERAVEIARALRANTEDQPAEAEQKYSRHPVFLVFLSVLHPVMLNHANRFEHWLYLQASAKTNKQTNRHKAPTIKQTINTRSLFAPTNAIFYA
jgi:hypothetical protein